MSQTLDAIDRNIIRLLRLDARMSSAKMAEIVGLSPSACLRRIRVMEQGGIIRGYTALIGSGEEGRTLAVMINITLDRQTEDSLNRFEDAVRKHPEIRECYLMTGDWDYFLRVEVESPKEFEAIHTDILSKLPGVTRIHSSFSIRNALMARSRRS